MARSLTVIFRRDPSRDRQSAHICHQGYQILWPEGQPVVVGLDAFCRHGLRLLALDRALAGSYEKLVELLCFPLTGLDDQLTRLPGHRVRRFFLRREGRSGRIHFLDGTATDVVFDLGRDQRLVLDWIGLTSLRDGERQWLDLAARTVEGAVPAPAAVSGAASYS